MSFTVTPKASASNGVNIRSGPGIEYDRVDGADSSESLNAGDTHQDENGTTWYKTDRGWMSGDHLDISSDVDDGSSGDTVPLENTPISDAPMSSDREFKEKKAIDMQSGTGVGDTLNSMHKDSVKAEDELNFYRRRIFGMPHQFLPATDIRPNGGNLGRVYMSNILTEAPVLSVLPCKPSYLPSLSDEKKKGVTEAMLAMVSDNVSDAAKQLAGEEVSKIETKYFTTDLDHVDYTKRVNFLLRSMSVFMEIGDRIVPGTTEKYKEYKWENYRMSNAIDNSKSSTSVSTDITEKTLKDISSGIENVNQETLLNAISTEQYYVSFFVTPSTSYSESITNRTETSMFENLVNKGEGMMKELAFLLGANALDAGVMQTSVANMSEDMKKALQNYNASGDGLFSRLLSNAKTIVSGSNIVFPEIWHDSSYDRSYRAEIKLISPYGDKESIFLNIIVPMIHMLVFAVPRQTTANTYGAPFMIKAHINKWFSCEMGIIDGIDIIKDGWSVDGFPTEVTMNVSFKDLYSSLMFSKTDSIADSYMFTQNDGLIEYLSVMCGLDLKKSQYKLKMDLIKAILGNAPADLVDYKAASIQQEAARKAASIFRGMTGSRF